MFFNSFRFGSLRLRSAFAPRKPRHPLLRLAFGVVGLGLLCLLVFFSLFVGAAMIAAGVLYELFNQRGRPLAAARNARVVEGEYRVVRKPVLPMPR
ncbi:MAG TPA: hypothetical protein VK325_00100 [Pseudoxanthomonas sp.]|nr:hypothetical protein [Pseudoxanthomonas sp.]